MNSDASVIKLDLELGDLKPAHASCQTVIEIGLSARIGKEAIVGGAGSNYCLGISFKQTRHIGHLSVACATLE